MSECQTLNTIDSLWRLHSLLYTCLYALEGESIGSKVGSTIYDFALPLIEKMVKDLEDD